MSNRLADETSPYLLQHQNNPVDWYPWGEEALGRAKTEGLPIFLSIGYSACHWCHVMEHESFENAQIADHLNRNFVCIKVDREERPDLDQIYMSAVQMISGRGGWPMSVFLTPDLKPFFGGTYWPPESRMGMPGFGQILDAVLDAWKNRREQAIEQASQLTEKIAEFGKPPAGDHDSLDIRLIMDAARQLEHAFDMTHGGFGQAPKFPHSMDLQVLLRVWRREPKDGILHMAKLSLDKMARGGIYDHLAGGFARYSVDAKWLVPHFEKMLYDNGLLMQVYLDAYLATRDETYQKVICETADYILNYMTDSRGGFHSTEDADSEGEEGKFYVWAPAEVQSILGEQDAEIFCYVYDVSDIGNFEGKNILNLPKTIEQCCKIKGWDQDELTSKLKSCQQKLLEIRDQRIRPSKDDKILVSWNGLMMDAMAQAGAALNDKRYIEAAVGAASFIRDSMTDSTDRLLHSFREGKAKLNAYLDDYTSLANALVSLYQATFDESWLVWSVDLMEQVIERFSDSDGPFFYTSNDHEALIARTKDVYDSSVPSGNGLAVTALIRLGFLCGRSDFLSLAERILTSTIGLMKSSPTATGQMLLGLDRWIGPSSEIVILGGSDADENRKLQSWIRSCFLPTSVIAYRDSNHLPVEASPIESLFQGRAFGAEPTCYVCRNNVCDEPVSGAEAIKTKIEGLG